MTTEIEGLIILISLNGCQRRSLWTASHNNSRARSLAKWFFSRSPDDMEPNLLIVMMERMLNEQLKAENTRLRLALEEIQELKYRGSIHRIDSVIRKALEEHDGKDKD